MYGKLKFSKDEGILSAQDLISVSGISSTEELRKRIRNLGDSIPVKFREGEAFFINQRNLNLIPSMLADKATPFTLFWDFLKLNWAWVGVWMLRSARRKHAERWHPLSSGMV